MLYDHVATPFITLLTSIDSLVFVPAADLASEDSVAVCSIRRIPVSQWPFL
jgi:hypothetical protein